MLLLLAPKSMLTPTPRPMAKVISGNRNQIPDGLEPMQWANLVWDTMTEQGVSQDEAKKIIAARYATKAEERPMVDKMMKPVKFKSY